MPRQMILRDYQEESADAVEHTIAIQQNPLVVIPTGGGKSIIIAETIKRLLGRRSQPSVLLLSHVKELIEQNSNTLRAYAPGIAQGIYSAGLKEKRASPRVVMGTVQTVSRALNVLGKREFILVDEAHLCPRKQESQYAKVFAHFRLATRIGFTATNLRLDSGTLTEGDDRWFDTVAHEEPVTKLIKDGWLVPLSGVLTEQQALLDQVKTRMGDFVAEQAEREVMKLSLYEVVNEMLSLTALRKHLLIFAAGKKHATAIHARLEAEGIKAGLVLGDTADEDRDHAIERFKQGKLRALVSVGVLTTGFDAPLVDCIVCMRPTKSGVLWQQILGRGMRLFQGKTNCLLLDFVGNLDRLGGAGCVTEVEDHRKPPREGEERGKGHGRERKTDFTHASHVDPMGISEDGAPFSAKVIALRYFLINSKQQPGKTLLCADYSLETDSQIRCGARSFVCVEFMGPPRQHAEEWFIKRGLTRSQVPTNARTALALAKVLPEPHEVEAIWDAKRSTYLVTSEQFPAPA